LYLYSYKMDETVTIANVRIANKSFNEVVETIIRWIDDRDPPRYVVTPNVDHIMKLQVDKEFRDVYQQADLILPDGMPLIWASKILGSPLIEKVSGSDLFVKLCERASEGGFRLFFLGGNPGDAKKAKEVLMRKYPLLKIVGVYCPPFGFERDECENSNIEQIIRKAEPDILFVGLGAPKQEKWIHAHYRAIGVPVSIGIGISFSYVAGAIRRAPLWMQKIGLEWFWRLLMEPKRLWKRYLVDDIKFFNLVLKQKFRQTFLI